MMHTHSREKRKNHASLFARSIRNHWLLQALTVMALCHPLAGHSQTRESDSSYKARILGDTSGRKTGITTPAEWIRRNKNLLISTETRALAGFDTSFMQTEFPKLLSTFELTEYDFNTNENTMRLRYMMDIRSKLNQLRQQVDGRVMKVKTINEDITSGHMELKTIQEDSLVGLARIDSRIWQAYKPEFDSIQRWAGKVDALTEDRIEGFVAIENRLNNLSFRAAETEARVAATIREEEASMLTPQHPPIWKLNGSTYPEGFVAVFMKTLRQSLDSLAFYGKHAYMRAILFRIFILLITLLPVWYFKRINKEKTPPAPGVHHRFMEEHTAKAASTFGLVLAPFIFVNSPLIFTEVILLTLAFTTSAIFIAEHPEVDKRSYYLILIYFIILKVFDLFMNVTLAGRIATTMSIFLLIPFWNLLKGVKRVDFKNKILPYLILYLTMAQLTLGWGLSVFGYYRMGRALVVSSLTGFFFAIILHVGVYALIDFILILSDLYNRRDSISKVRIGQVYGKLVNLFTIPAFLFWIGAFLKNTNSFDFVIEQLSSIYNLTLSFGSFILHLGSALIFLTCLVVAIYISGLLKGLFFEEHRENQIGVKTSVGSYVILFRLFFIAAGFVVGMIAAGIPLNNINLIIGALGVGIGFGLQTIINNLVSGVVLAFEKPIYVGDIVEVDGVKGKVSEIGIRATTLAISEGSEYIVPNGDLLSNKMKNWTLNDRHMRVDNTILTAIGNDPTRVIAVMQEAALATGRTSVGRELRILLTDIKPNALVFSLRCWVDDITLADAARTEILTSIHEAFAREGIKYPRPEEIKGID